ncbi:MAG: chemotaxis protein CheW [Fischerella sp.]|jgi:purine-binding chemotaxis protein CheW|uniref:chemotaxis protein CheW n=1 Tax=Fischerella sp. TaxID=1191 RepID=UPI001810560C|nr:chemotaxis protein CheW [Fischerella sp.]NWF59698.1 chemotaxis protein CheW [Fischerella sp.]
MKNKEYLTFRIHNLLYGIDADLVQEMFPLPELIPITEAPSDIIGILLLREQIVPIVHIGVLLDYPLKDCQLSDYVIVVLWKGLQIGLLVHEVNQVLELDATVIEQETFFGLINHVNAAFIAGIAKVKSDTILLLNFEKLIRQPDALVTLIWDAESQLDRITAFTSFFYDLYCPNATSEERAIFKQRADNLRQSVQDLKFTKNLISLAVIGFGTEYFGLELELIQEFTDIRNLTPIPCCPKHIIGNMNLRGEIITLVDIRNILNLSITPVKVGSKAVVVQVDDIVAGLPVDQVFEVIYLNSAEIIPLPTGNKKYLLGTTPFQEKTLSVIDLRKIFINGELAVNEEV